MLASLERGESCQTQNLFSSFSSHLQWQERKGLPFGDVLQHYCQACIYSCPTRASGSCPGPFFLICFHSRIAEGGSWFTKCIPLMTKLWSGVKTAWWGLDFCTAAEQRREILWWGAPKNPHVFSHLFSQAISTCFVSGKICRHNCISSHIFWEDVQYCNGGSYNWPRNSTGS